MYVSVSMYVCVSAFRPTKVYKYIESFERIKTLENIKLNIYYSILIFNHVPISLYHFKSSNKINLKIKLK